MVPHHNIIFIATSISLSSLLSKYPLQIPPSLQLDIIGRGCNAYQVLAHLLFAYQVMTLKQQDSIYGGHDNQQLLEFVMASALDYLGWITLFSRLPTVPWSAKMLANSHVTAIIMARLDFETFQTLYIRATYNNIWMWTRVAFLIADGLTRGYYQFVVL